MGKDRSGRCSTSIPLTHAMFCSELPALIARAPAPSSNGIGPEPPSLPQHENADDREIEGICRHRRTKGRGIESKMIIEHACEPCPNGHAGAAAEKKCRDPPIG